MGRSVRPAESIEHEFPLVVELQTEPVPSNQILIKIRGSELMVHPTRAGHVERFVPDRECSGCGQSGEGIVVRGLSCGRAFVTDAVGAMHHKRFFRRDCELDGHVAIRCLKCLSVGSGHRRFGAPPIDPDVEMVLCRTSFTQAGSAHFVRIVKPALAEIADGEMGQVQVRDGPLRRQGLRLIARHATAEEGELIAERPAILRGDLAGVVPPFGAKLLMRPVVARERISIAFRGKAELLRGLDCEPWNNDRQTTQKEQDVSERARQYVHVGSTVREMKYALRALISCSGTWHKSPVLTGVFIDSTRERYPPRAVDNFVDHQLS